MARIGLTTSGSYTSQSVNAADDKLENLYCETNEDPNGKSPMSLYHTAGLSQSVYQLVGPSVRGMYFFNGRMFAVSGPSFYECLPNGTTTNVNPVGNDNSLVSFTAGPNQILFASAGMMYVFNLTSNILTPVNPATYIAPIFAVAYVDGFFLAVTKGSGEFQVSTPDDATSWNLLDESIVSVFPDSIVAMQVAYRQPIFFGPKQSQAYFDSGQAITPIIPVPGGFIEQGAVSSTAISFLDNSIFWLGADSRGSAIAWRANGYTPARVSTHATEFAWQGYSTVSDAISYSFQDQGHTFWHLYFPTANKSWRYDAATQLWHEVSYLNGGMPTAHRSQVYCFAFGKHLVGDWASGNIYEMNIKYLTDFGQPIERKRRAPIVSNENQYIFHHQLQVDVETGLGPQPPLLDGRGFRRGPMMNLRWSDDSGHTWSNTYAVDCGQAGAFKTRAIWRRLGRSRARVYELTMTDPIPWRIIDAYLIADPGYEVSSRISDGLRKVS